VHVHVHRDKEPAKPAERTRRPTLSGVLFSWKSHYDPVAEKHKDELVSKEHESRWTRIFGKGPKRR